MSVRRRAFRKHRYRVFLFQGFANDLDLAADIHPARTRNKDSFVDPTKRTDNRPTGDPVLRDKRASGLPGNDRNIKPRYVI